MRLSLSLGLMVTMRGRMLVIVQCGLCLPAPQILARDNNLSSARSARPPPEPGQQHGTDQAWATGGRQTIM